MNHPAGENTKQADRAGECCMPLKVIDASSCLGGYAERRIWELSGKGSPLLMSSAGEGDFSYLQYFLLHLETAEPALGANSTKAHQGSKNQLLRRRIEFGYPDHTAVHLGCHKHSPEGSPRAGCVPPPVQLPSTLQSSCSEYQSATFMLDVLRMHVSPCCAPGLSLVLWDD